MKKELIQVIKIQIAITLISLLETSKKFSPINKTNEQIIESYNRIAVEADIRKATVSDAFNAKSITGPNSTTVFLIVKAMGYTLSDFAKKYDSITEADVEKFKKTRKI
ncbi:MULTISPECIES: hypothetical protein [Aequorivita]|uniref:Uncharacterized protein n=1 Tax=Aequorivita iocasae TaxID=2803865 RepID=A0ABX7DRT0_9FLAO|nr:MULTISPECIES: hypothetical protein [Aequorivita]QQX76462.1 hypothetical protein JK629_14230 [Aequorivita iocasae]UCA55934.1 hypothetical protein LDL78_14300 [Aequorivita sp. F7]